MQPGCPAPARVTRALARLTVMTRPASTWCWTRCYDTSLLQHAACAYGLTQPAAGFTGTHSNGRAPHDTKEWKSGRQRKAERTALLNFFSAPCTSSVASGLMTGTVPVCTGGADSVTRSGRPVDSSWQPLEPSCKGSVQRLVCDQGPWTSVRFWSHVVMQHMTRQ